MRGVALDRLRPRGCGALARYPGPSAALTGKREREREGLPWHGSAIHLPLSPLTLVHSSTHSIPFHSMTFHSPFHPMTFHSPFLNSSLSKPPCCRSANQTRPRHARVQLLGSLHTSQGTAARRCVLATSRSLYETHPLVLTNPQWAGRRIGTGTSRCADAARVRYAVVEGGLWGRYG